MKVRKTISTFLIIMLLMITMTLTTVSAQSTGGTSSDSEMGILCMVYMCVLIVPFIIWVIAAIYINNDARKLGVENPWLWGLLVFFTGIVGLIIYLAIIRPKAKEDQMRGPSNYPSYGGAYAGLGDTPRKDGTCRHCGKYAGATVGKCTYCGSDL